MTAMNILEVEDLIKGLPDEALMQEAQQPSGQYGYVPQFLLISEIQRRTDMRDRYQAQLPQEQRTVADQIIQEAMAPQGAPGMGPPPMNGGPPPMPPQMLPPPQMAGGPPPMPPGMPPQMPQGMPPMPPGMPPGMPMAHGGAVPMQSNGGVPDAMIGQAIRQVPNAFIEDSNKFNEAALADISPSDIPALTAMTQTIDMGIPRVLPMAHGGVVEMQEGRLTDVDLNEAFGVDIVPQEPSLGPIQTYQKLLSGLRERDVPQVDFKDWIMALEKKSDERARRAAMIAFGSGIAGGSVAKGLGMAGEAMLSVQDKYDSLLQQLKLAQLRGDSEAKQAKLEREIQIAESQLRAAVDEEEIKQADKRAAEAIIAADKRAEEERNPFAKFSAAELAEKFTPPSIKEFGESGWADPSVLVEKSLTIEDVAADIDPTDYTEESLQAFYENYDKTRDINRSLLIAKEDQREPYAPLIAENYTAASLEAFAKSGYTDYSLLDPREGAEKDPSGQQSLSAIYATTITDANSVLDDLYEGADFSVGAWEKVEGLGFMPTKFKQEDYVRFEVAKKFFVNSWLRRTSGAAITPTEMTEAEAAFFPVPMDPPAAIEQKRRNRRIVQAGLIAESGPVAMGKIYEQINKLNAEDIVRRAELALETVGK